MNIVKQTSAFPLEDNPQRGFPQMWECSACLKVRQWGIGPTPTPKEHPFLLCECQPEGYVRHKFVGLKQESIA